MLRVHAVWWDIQAPLFLSLGHLRGASLCGIAGAEKSGILSLRLDAVSAVSLPFW